MNYIHRFPFILSSLVTVVIGVISYKCSDDLKTTCIKMALSIIVFYAIGIIVRRTILEIMDEVERKKEEDDHKEQVLAESGSNTDKIPDLSLQNNDSNV